MDGLFDNLKLSEIIFWFWKISLSALFLSVGETGERGDEDLNPSSSLKSLWLLYMNDLVPSLPCSRCVSGVLTELSL